MTSLLPECFVSATRYLQGIYRWASRNTAEYRLLPPARGKVGMGVIKIHCLFRTTPTRALPLQGGGDKFLEHSPYFTDVAACGARQ